MTYLRNSIAVGCMVGGLAMAATIFAAAAEDKPAASGDQGWTAKPSPVGKSEKKTAPAVKSVVKGDAKTANSDGGTAAGKKGAVPGAQAQAGSGTRTAIGDWVLLCASPETSCTLNQLIADGKGRKIVMFKAQPSNSGPFLEADLPLGLSIPFGVALVLGKDTVLPMQLADCRMTGCRAVVALDAATIGKIKTSGGLAVRFQDSQSGKVLTVKGSIKGLGDGVARIASK